MKNKSKLTAFPAVNLKDLKVTMKGSSILNLFRASIEQLFTRIQVCANKDLASLKNAVENSGEVIRPTPYRQRKPTIAVVEIKPQDKPKEPRIITVEIERQELRDPKIISVEIKRRNESESP